MIPYWPLLGCYSTHAGISFFALFILIFIILLLTESIKQPLDPWCLWEPRTLQVTFPSTGSLERCSIYPVNSLSATHCSETQRPHMAQTCKVYEFLTLQTFRPCQNHNIHTFEQCSHMQANWWLIVCNVWTMAHVEELYLQTSKTCISLSLYLSLFELLHKTACGHVVSFSNIRVEHKQ